LTNIPKVVKVGNAVGEIEGTLVTGTTEGRREKKRQIKNQLLFKTTNNFILLYIVTHIRNNNEAISVHIPRVGKFVGEEEGDEDGPRNSKVTSGKIYKYRRKVRQLLVTISTFSCDLT